HRHARGGRLLAHPQGPCAGGAAWPRDRRRRADRLRACRGPAEGAVGRLSDARPQADRRRRPDRGDGEGSGGGFVSAGICPRRRSVGGAMIAAGPAAIAACVASLALLLAPPAGGAGRSPVGPAQLAFTRSIDVQDEDEFQTSLSAGHLRLPHERSTTVRAEVEYGVTDRVQAIVALPYGVRDLAGEAAVSGLEDLELVVRYGL